MAWCHHSTLTQYAVSPPALEALPLSQVLRDATLRSRIRAWADLVKIREKFYPILSYVHVKRFRACKFGVSKMKIEGTSHLRSKRKCNHVFLAVFKAEVDEHMEEWVGSIILFVKVEKWDGVGRDILEKPLAVVRWYAEPLEVVLSESAKVGKLNALTVQPSWDDNDTEVGVIAVEDMCGLVGLAELDDAYMVLGRRLVLADMISAS